MDLLFTKALNIKTRGHLLKLVGDRFKNNKRKFFSGKLMELIATGCGRG